MVHRPYSVRTRIIGRLASAHQLINKSIPDSTSQSPIRRPACHVSCVRIRIELNAYRVLPPKIERTAVIDQKENVLRGRTGIGYLMLLAVLLHRNEATDWAGRNVNVESEDCVIHHIFPRELLKGEEYEDELINCLGNLTFIDRSINGELLDTPPDVYLKDYVSRHDIFDRHMIPSDTRLWKLENYGKFLDTRAEAYLAKNSGAPEGNRGVSRKGKWDKCSY